MEKANWSCLCPWVLKEFADRVASLGDRICVAAVCRSWRAAILETDFDRTYPPYLILFDQENGGGGSDRNAGGGVRHLWLGDFSSFCRRRLRLPPALIGWLPFGACHSWLGMMDQSNASACLFDPFTGDVVRLPPTVDAPACAGPSSLEPWYPLKLCLSSPDPDADPSCVAVVIRNRTRRLAYAVPGGRGDWMTLDHPDIKGYDDVLCVDGVFFAITQDRVLVYAKVITNGGRHAETRLGDVTIILRLVSPPADGRLFLAIHPDRELVVVSMRDDFRYPAPLDQVTGVSKIENLLVREKAIQTLGDCILVLPIDPDRKLVVVKLRGDFRHPAPLDQVSEIENVIVREKAIQTLGNCILFLGCSCSLSIAASQVEGCMLRESAIYFASDCWVPANAYGTALLQEFIWDNDHYRRRILARRKPAPFLIPPMWIAPRIGQI